MTQSPTEIRAVKSVDIAAAPYPWRRSWPVVPTYAHGGIGYGEITGAQR